MKNYEFDKEKYSKYRKFVATVKLVSALLGVVFSLMLIGGLIYFFVNVLPSGVAAVINNLINSIVKK